MLAAAGCYKPNLRDPPFVCAEAGKRCPDGFTCDPTDNLCHRGASQSGDGSSMCTEPTVARLCDDQPASGQMCNPACQIGCDCGRRCNVGSNGQTFCTTVGTKTVGQLCAVANDDCAPGLICLQEACGNLLGRCYRHCDSDAQCGTQFCQFPIPGTSVFRACDQPAQSCNPVENTGCPSPALNCYLTSANETRCDCPSGLNHALGDTCQFYNDCMPGLICISNVGGLAGPHCHTACDTAAPVCPGNTCIATMGSKYSYCGP
jgi:hypothetical protein